MAPGRVLVFVGLVCLLGPSLTAAQEYFKVISLNAGESSLYGFGEDGDSEWECPFSSGGVVYYRTYSANKYHVKVLYKKNYDDSETETLYDSSATGTTQYNHLNPYSDNHGGCFQIVLTEVGGNTVTIYAETELYEDLPWILLVLFYCCCFCCFFPCVMALFVLTVAVSILALVVSIAVVLLAILCAIVIVCSPVLVVICPAMCLCYCAMSLLRRRRRSAPQNPGQSGTIQPMPVYHQEIANAQGQPMRQVQAPPMYEVSYQQPPLPVPAWQPQAIVPDPGAKLGKADMVVAPVQAFPTAQVMGECQGDQTSAPQGPSSQPKGGHVVVEDVDDDHTIVPLGAFTGTGAEERAEDNDKNSLLKH